QVINNDGNNVVTNTVSGLIERNNMFWLENVPLNGTDQISIQATDASGLHTTVTNITLLPATVQLTIDNTPTGDDLWQPTGTVSGTVSDPAAIVTINGTNATVNPTMNGAGTYDWSATGVPINVGGTAVFDVQSGSSTVSGSPEKAPFISIIEYHSSWDLSGFANSDLTMESAADDFRRQKDYYNYLSPNYVWDPADICHGHVSDANRSGPSLENFNAFTDADYEWTALTGAASYTNNIGQSGSGPLDPKDDSWDWVTAIPDTDADSLSDYLASKTHYHWLLHNQGGWPTEDIDLKINSTSQVKLSTGGKAGVNRRTLFCLTNSAERHDQFGSVDVVNTLASTPVANTNLMIGSFGAARADGTVWCSLPANSIYDITVHIPGVQHFSASTPPVRDYALAITANDTSLDAFPPPDFCVGQLVKLKFTGIPPDCSATNISWGLAGNYVTDFTNAFPGSTYPDCSRNYFLNTNSLTGAEVDAWWVSGGSPANYRVSVGCDLVQAGQVFASASGYATLIMSKPDLTWTGTKTGHVAFGVPYEDPIFHRTNFLHFGYFVATSNQPGVTFKIQTNSYWGGFSGTFTPIQTMSTSDEACGTNGYSAHITGIGLDAGIDKLPTLDHVNFWDDPAIGCESVNSHVWISTEFKTYWMFQPSDSGSINVPIKIVTWNWQGTADSSGGWHLVSSGSDGNVTGSNLDPPDFPTWTNILGASNLQGYTSITNTSCDH
ncbi:MAG TPA: hypothetical protein VG347_23625, partial [Verrucomicrobiae bacterium]|nr:hypothetical protein [Verrucomicrobiae bacterium]